jgi:hypothetical protein
MLQVKGEAENGYACDENQREDPAAAVCDRSNVWHGRLH